MLEDRKGPLLERFLSGNLWGLILLVADLTILRYSLDVMEVSRLRGPVSPSFSVVLAAPKEDGAAIMPSASSWPALPPSSASVRDDPFATAPLTEGFSLSQDVNRKRKNLDTFAEIFAGGRANMFPASLEPMDGSVRFSGPKE